MKIKTTNEIYSDVLIVAFKKRMYYINASKEKPKEKLDLEEKWAKINELIVWLQDTFGNADNVNLIVAELGRLKDE